MRRTFVLLLFVGLLAFFRHLGPLFVFFVVFERILNTLGTQLSEKTGLKFKHSVLLSLLGMAGAVAGTVYFGVSTVLNKLPQIREGFETISTTIRESQLYHQYGHVAGERVLEQGRHHIGDALHYAASAGRGALYVFIGLVFAVVFLMDRDELEEWRENMHPDSVVRILLRYFGHLSDAVAITLKLQIIVALVNACLTLPILLALDLPGIPALVALMVGTGLIPVVGGPVAGAVLMTLAYIKQGPSGLAFFMVTTFVLHKIESYFLAPRLTAKHVRLPGFVIITSLVLFEHTFGLVGLFLSFPSLYVAAKIREGWIDPEDEIREDLETEYAMKGPRMSKEPPRPAALDAPVSVAEPPIPVKDHPSKTEVPSVNA